MKSDRRHILHMRHAISLARRALGSVAPNPAVGCVIVKDRKIIGRGHTQVGGRPHAETVALDQVGPQACGATAYVTLEPCAHFGQTPPCAQALINAEISTVYIGSHDPDPRVSGKGVQMLLDAGIEVFQGVLEDETNAINYGFISKISNIRPHFTSKFSTSLDGKIALGNGQSKWITGEQARLNGHALRASHDAILVGVGTVLADDPMLDCRIEGLTDKSPARVVLDTNLRTPLSSKLVTSANSIPTYIVTSSGLKHDTYGKNGIKIILVEDMQDLKTVSEKLAELGMTRVLIEGGANVHASFLKAGLVDEIKHYIAPLYIGDEGLSCVSNLDISSLIDVNRYKRQELAPLGADLLASYIREE